MKKCPFCAEEIQDEAIVCKHCGREITATTTPTAPSAEKSSPIGGPMALGGIMIAFVGFFVAVVGGGAMGVGFLIAWLGLAMTIKRGAIVRLGGSFVGALLIVALAASMHQDGASSTSRTTSRTAATTSGTRGPAAESNLTLAQRNAARSAQSYLVLSGFSRQGLIGQLSSEYGDKFSVEDATAAVDSLDVDWDAQAARAAAAYLTISGFSCQGLIEQLSSQHGDKYTVEQATYGATQAGIC